MNGLKKKKDLFFVGIQILLFALYVVIPPIFPFNGNIILQIAGLVLAFTGFGICCTSLYLLRKSLTPFPTPLQKGILVTSGIYRYIRHPVYSGIWLMVAGFGFYSAHAGRLSVACLLGMLFYFKSRYEEEMLKAVYPGYRSYMAYAGRFFPKLRKNQKHN
ncbi:hypothetical protein DYBT9275_02518 [Dyadobacter sp. CECT 9275]|uniref:Isoprenylcysteine carboxylmethyltransferase family protein n=1 Tax=Dyadobacter helix TaxID=2822344 RepID=A0A916JCS5_9BACT|nr:isoprenylcysteine carboxylmethyltransferase family protein [Dyadobacter sp. CECT 9275]CAG5000714.1 hypothetical protein DYBT9275_02518 [Dyadobacter sp. CECT 9275]